MKSYIDFYNTQAKLLFTYEVKDTDKVLFFADSWGRCNYDHNRTDYDKEIRLYFQGTTSNIKACIKYLCGKGYISKTQNQSLQGTEPMNTKNITDQLNWKPNVNEHIEESDNPVFDTIRDVRKIYRIAPDYYKQNEELLKRRYTALKYSAGAFDRRLFKSIFYCDTHGFLSLNPDDLRVWAVDSIEVGKDELPDADPKIFESESRKFRAVINPTLAKVDSSIIWLFTSNDDIRPIMTGIHYEDGFQVATDAHVLIKLKQDYPASKEGKTISKTRTIEGIYPNFNAVIPKEGNDYKPELVDLRVWCQQIVNFCKWTRQDTKNIIVAINHEGKLRACYDLLYLQLFLSACTLLKSLKFRYTDETRALMAYGSDGSTVLLMPKLGNESAYTFNTANGKAVIIPAEIDYNNIEFMFEQHRKLVSPKVAALADFVIELLGHPENHRNEPLLKVIRRCCEVINKKIQAAASGLNGVKRSRRRKPMQYSLFGTDEEYKERLRAFLTEHAEPFRFVKCDWNNFLSEFGTEGECQSPIGTIILKYDDLEKMQQRFRQHYFGLVKPTLQRPVFVIKHRERQLFVKSFINKENNTVIFFSVVKSEDGEFELSSNHTKQFDSLVNKIREGEITADPHHFTTALNGPDRPLPNYLYLSVGFPFMCKKNKKRMEATTVDTHQLTTTLNGPDRPLSNCCVPSVGLSSEDKNTKKSIPQTKSVNNTGLGFVPFTQKSDVKTERLKGDLGKFIGAFDRNQFSIVLRGDKGAGKSRLLYQLINAFAAKGLKVGFYSLEMGTQSSVTQRYKAEYLKRNNLLRIDINTDSPDYVQLSAACKQYDVVAIDSWTKLKDVRQNDFDRLQKENPNTVIVAVFQSTTGKVTRGGNMPEYDGGIVIHVKTGGIAECEKNRYAATDKEYSVFEQKLIEE